MLRKSSKICRILRKSWKSFEILRNSSEFFGILRNSSKFSEILRNSSKFFGNLWNSSKFFGNPSEFFGNPSDPFGFLRISWEFSWFLNQFLLVSFGRTMDPIDYYWHLLLFFFIMGGGPGGPPCFSAMDSSWIPAENISFCQRGEETGDRREILEVPKSEPKTSSCLARCFAIQGRKPKSCWGIDGPGWPWKKPYKTAHCEKLVLL